MNITSGYEFLLRLVNTFTIDNEDYYRKCYNLGVSLYALRSQQNIRMLQKNGSHLTVVFKNHDLVL